MNDIATNIHVRFETLLTAGAICEQLMHITSPIVTIFSALVRTASPSCACRHLEKYILNRKVAIAYLDLSARRPRILVGEVTACGSQSPSSEPKKKVRSVMRTTSLSCHSQNEVFRSYRKSQATLNSPSIALWPDGRKL
jgi:hypothetical protein